MNPWRYAVSLYPHNQATAFFVYLFEKDNDDGNWYTCIENIRSPSFKLSSSRKKTYYYYYYIHSKEEINDSIVPIEKPHIEIPIPINNFEMSPNLPPDTPQNERNNLLINTDVINQQPVILDTLTPPISPFNQPFTQFYLDPRYYIKYNNEQFLYQLIRSPTNEEFNYSNTYIQNSFLEFPPYTPESGNYFFPKDKQ